MMDPFGGERALQNIAQAFSSLAIDEVLLQSHRSSRDKAKQAKKNLVWVAAHPKTAENNPPRMIFPEAMLSTNQSQKTYAPRIIDGEVVVPSADGTTDFSVHPC